MWDAAALYVDRTVPASVTLNHIETEVEETIWAYNKVGDMIPYIVNNVLWSVSGSHGVTQFTDTTITDSNNTVYSQFTPTAATSNAMNFWTVSNVFVDAFRKWVRLLKNHSNFFS